MNKKELKARYTDMGEIGKILHFTDEEAISLKKIADQYPVAVTDYYLSLIDPGDPNDAIRKMCIPSIAELARDGETDTSGEADNTVALGIQHKYKQTALILSTNQCAMYCRHCFRKRMVGATDEEITRNLEAAVQYVTEHEEISNVLITGGDSLMLPNRILEQYLLAFTRLDHLDLIRFGTRIPVVNPDRVLDDLDLQDIFWRYAARKQLYIVTQFNHPRELTAKARACIRVFIEMGIVVKNQTVLLKGVNDDPKTLGALLRGLTSAGVIPYYIFQCRPVRGIQNQFQVPLRRGVRIVDEAKNMQNGQGKCLRYCMSTPRGKVEILGMQDDTHMLFKFHQAKYPEDAGRIFTAQLTVNQGWLEF